MSFNIYYGNGDKLANQKLIDSFDTLKQAEEFLFKYIKEHHQDSCYIRTLIFSNTHRKYDYGDYDMFYTIINCLDVVAAIIFKDNKVFITQRGYGEFKDKWEFPGGKIKKGESKKEALIREIKEELDIEIEVSDLITTIEYEYDNFYLFLNCYKASLKDNYPKLLEHESALWVSKDEIDHFDWLPADLEVIKLIKNILE